MSSCILIPVDNSTRAREALEFALNEHADAEITVIHVISPTAVIGVTDPAAWHDQMLDRKREATEELLSEIRHEANTQGSDIRTEIVYGNTPQSIEYVGDNDIDQIVMGSHGGTGFSRVLLGSIAETVVRRAPVPVTVVR